MPTQNPALLSLGFIEHRLKVSPRFRIAAGFHPLFRIQYSKVFHSHNRIPCDIQP